MVTDFPEPDGPGWRLEAPTLEALDPHAASTKPPNASMIPVKMITLSCLMPYLRDNGVVWIANSAQQVIGELLQHYHHYLQLIPRQERKI